MARQALRSYRLTRHGRAVWVMSTTFVLALVSVAATATTSQAVTYTCGPSGNYTLCLTTGTSVLTGNATIFADPTPISLTPGGIVRVEFTWNGQYLIYVYQAPYQFVWPTARQIDGSGVLSARVVTSGVPGAWVSVRLSVANGDVTSFPLNPADWASAFVPQPFSGDPIIAAVGSGAAGKPDEASVISSIQAHHPTAFLYLGDVDEFGNWTTLDNHYGWSALDPGGAPSLWGAMAKYTAPTPGNHEGGTYQSTWQDYWHQRPLWSTFTIGDIRFFDLSSNCGAVLSCTASAQTTWLTQQLAANTSRCIVSFWHIPLVSEDYARNQPNMSALWTLLAQHGGDLVINAHTHDMEQTAPLNGSLVAGKADSHMVELISGGAAGRWELQFAPDSRVVWELYKTAGALYVTSVHNTNGSESLKWTFDDTAGNVLRTGSVTC